VRPVIVAFILGLIALPAHAAEAGSPWRGTSWSIFGLFLLLVYLGLRATRSRVSGWFRVVLNAVVFLGWGLATLLIRPDPVHALLWMVTAGGGVGLALLTVCFAEMDVDRRRGLVQLPASWLPLTRNMTVFTAKYAIAVLMLLLPQAQSQLALWDLGVSGASAGYFAAWLLRFWHAYRGAPSVAEAAEAHGRI
jgi:hypothetical protein